jgi:hypothetical protein
MNRIVCVAVCLWSLASRAAEPLFVNAYEKDLLTLINRYVVCNAYPVHSLSLYPRTLSNGLFNGAAFNKLFGNPTDRGPPPFYKIQNARLTTQTQSRLKAIVDSFEKSKDLKDLYGFANPTRLAQLNDQEFFDTVGQAMTSPRAAGLKDAYQSSLWDLRLAELDRLIVEQRKQAQTMTQDSKLQAALFDVSRETTQARDRLAQKHPLAVGTQKPTTQFTADAIKNRILSFRETAINLAKSLESEVNADLNRKCTKEDFKVLRQTLDEITNGRLVESEMKYVEERLQRDPELAKKLDELYKDLSGAALSDESPTPKDHK